MVVDRAVTAPAQLRHFTRVVTICAAALALHAATAARAADRFDNHRDWAIYRGDKRATQYSELDQIDATNVGQLEVAW